MRGVLLFNWLFILSLAGLAQQVPFSYSDPGGFYEESFEWSILVNPDLTVRYTLDGTAPTPESTRYTHPMFLDSSMLSPANISQIAISPPDLYHPPSPNRVQKAIIIRAAIFNDSGMQLSDILTHTYFIRSLGIEPSPLPVLSIAANHPDLFDYETGIFVPGIHWDPENPDWTGNYYLTGENWERKVFVEYFASAEDYDLVMDSGQAMQPVIRQYAGLRTHGGNARRFAQKGLRLYARDEYGTNRFEFPLFEEHPLQSFKRLVLKPISSSWSDAGIEDHLSCCIASALNLEAPASRPIQLYLNGEYWGIYFLQERFDDFYFADHFEYDRDRIDLIENWAGVISEGENDDFLDLYQFIENNDLSNPVIYQEVANRIDIDNFIESQLYEIFIANYDWPANNMKCWRARPSGKWRWTFYDGDAALKNTAFDMFSHALCTGDDSWPTNAATTLFFRKLMENEDFRNRFFERAEILLNDTLSPARTLHHFTAIVQALSPTMPSQIQRFNYPSNLESWKDDYLKNQSFLTLRPCELVNQVEEKFQRTMLVEGCEENAPYLTELEAYPNPNSGTVHLRIESDINDIGVIVLSDLVGKPLFSDEFPVIKGKNDWTLPDLALSNGIWLISLKTRHHTSTVKLYVVNP